MTLTPRMSNVAASAAADAVTALLNTGYLRIYDGTQPATADTAITTQNLLAELRFGATAFGGSVNGVSTANAITSAASAAATGTAAWYRCLKSDGTTVVIDGSIGTSGANMTMATLAIQILAVVSCSAFTHTQSKT